LYHPKHRGRRTANNPRRFHQRPTLPTARPNRRPLSNPQLPELSHRSPPHPIQPEGVASTVLLGPGPTFRDPALRGRGAG
jgi:hypothetical protein